MAPSPRPRMLRRRPASFDLSAVAAVQALPTTVPPPAPTPSLPKAPAHHRNPYLTRKDYAGKSIATVTKSTSPYEILPDLAASISYINDMPLTPPQASQSQNLQRKLSGLYFVAQSCRESSSLMPSTGKLTMYRAKSFVDAIFQFLEAIITQGITLRALNFIFAMELEIPEDAERTQRLVLTLLAELPFVLDTWSNCWLGLLEGNWPNVWQLVYYLRMCEERDRGEWRPEKAGWLVSRLVKVAEVDCEHIFPWRNDVPGDKKMRRPIVTLAELEEFGRAYEKEELKISDPSGETPAPRIEDQETKTDPPREEKNDPPSWVRPKPVVPKHSPRKAGLQPPSPGPNLIEYIVERYGELPRIQIKKSMEHYQLLLRHKESEEDFNKEKRRNRNGTLVREGLEREAARFRGQSNSEGTDSMESTREVGNEKKKRGVVRSGG